MTFFRTGTLVTAGLLLLWFRLAMNYDSEPIFKPNELRAAYHDNRSVRLVICTYSTHLDLPLKFTFRGCKMFH